jgi:hypothetical protein
MLNEATVSTTFLFGAGASYGSGPCTPHPPPLGFQLFDELVKQGGVAARVGPELAAAFRADFETGMDRFWRERVADTSELLRDMARYLAVFVPARGNHYIELIRSMGTREYVMATTNYDLLIEQSAGAHRLPTHYYGLPLPGPGVAVLKIHGSCNFLPDTLGVTFHGTRFRTPDNGTIIDSPTKVVFSKAEVLGFCNSTDSIAPCIAIYSPSKRVLYNPDFVKKQQEAWQQSVAAAARVYIIGMRVHDVDAHIWGVIDKVKVPVYYVGREPQEFQEWAESVGLQTGQVLAESFEEALPLIARHHEGL